MFVIPIVSCTSTLVAPSNLSIIALLSNMEVYNSSLKFKKIENVNHEKKSWFPYIWAPLSSTIQNLAMGKPYMHHFNNAIFFMICSYT